MRILRDVGVDTKILRVTACDELTVKEMYVQVGLDRFVTKPLTIEKVASFLNNITCDQRSSIC